MFLRSKRHVQVVKVVTLALLAGLAASPAFATEPPTIIFTQRQAPQDIAKIKHLEQQVLGLQAELAEAKKKAVMPTGTPYRHAVLGVIELVDEGENGSLVLVKGAVEGLADGLFAGHGTVLEKTRFGAHIAYRLHPDRVSKSFVRFPTDKFGGL